MRETNKNVFLGRWRIVETAVWARDALDLVVPAHITFGSDGLGETDLSLRTISPFGLLEPLLWLLEMNGYPVLD